LSDGLSCSDVEVTQAASDIEVTDALDPNFPTTLMVLAARHPEP
jgi:hypothetical protein